MARVELCVDMKLSLESEIETNYPKLVDRKNKDIFILTKDSVIEYKLLMDDSPKVLVYVLSIEEFKEKYARDKHDNCDYRLKTQVEDWFNSQGIFVNTYDEFTD